MESDVDSFKGPIFRDTSGAFMFLSSMLYSFHHIAIGAVIAIRTVNWMNSNGPGHREAVFMGRGPTHPAPPNMSEIL